MDKRIAELVVQILGGYEDHVAAALGITEDLSLERIATTFDDWIAVCWTKDHGSKAAAQALARALALASSFDDWVAVYKETPSYSDTEVQALAKVMSLASSFSDWLIVNDLMPSGSDAATQALARAMSLATTIKEWEQCFHSAEAHSEEEYACIRAIAKSVEKQEQETVAASNQ